MKRRNPNPKKYIPGMLPGYQLPKAMLPVGKRPLGRPTNYREVYARLVYKLRLAGLTGEQIADIMEVPEEQITQWRHKVAEFNDAWEEGGILADAEVARKLYHRAIGYSHKAEKVFPSTKDRGIERIHYTEHYPPDVGAAKAWLYNRQPALWKERQTTEHTNPDGSPLLPPTIVVNPVQAVQINFDSPPADPDELHSQGDD